MIDTSNIEEGVSVEFHDNSHQEFEVPEDIVITTGTVQLIPMSEEDQEKVEDLIFLGYLIDRLNQ